MLYRVNNVDISLSVAIEDYISAQINRRLTHSTIATYSKILEIFSRGFPHDPHPDTITLRDMDKFFTGLRHLSDKRVQNYHTVLSAFWGWMQKRGYTCENILNAMDLPKPGESPIIPYTRGEVDRMIKATYRKPWVGVMLRALVVSLAGTGIRVSEACAIRMKDYRDLHFIIRRAKGKKVRRVFVPEPAQNAIALYLSTRETPEPDDFLFLSGLHTPLSRKRVYKLVKDLGDAAGVPDATVHRFRHFYATEFLRNGGDIKYLKEILGHSDIKTTEKYLRVEPEDISRAAQRFNPLGAELD